jgi:hypothetical protein
MQVVRTPTPAQPPLATAVAERWVGTVRRACPDWLLITGERHLQQVLRAYPAHDHTARPHRALGLRPPLGPRSYPVSSRARSGAVCRRDRLGGLLHEYARAA